MSHLNLDNSCAAAKSVAYCIRACIPAGGKADNTGVRPGQTMDMSNRGSLSFQGFIMSLEPSPESSE